MVSEALPINKLIESELSVKPELTLPFPLSAERKFLMNKVTDPNDLSFQEQLEFISFFTHTDFIVAESAITFFSMEKDLSKVEPEIIESAQTVLDHPDIDRRRLIALLLGKLGEESLPSLDILLHDEEDTVRNAAVISLKGKPFELVSSRLLESWREERDENNRIQILNTYATYAQPEVNTFLEDILHGGEVKEIKEEVQILLVKKRLQSTNNPKQAIVEYIESSNNEKTFIVLAKALSRLPNAAFPILDALKAKNYAKSNLNLDIIIGLTDLFSRDSNKTSGLVDVIPVQTIQEKLLWSRKSLFAVDDPSHLITVVNGIGAWVSEVQKNFGDAFVGVSVRGSTAEGYRTDKSDIDASIIVRNAGIVADVINLYQHHLQKWDYDRASSVVVTDEKNLVRDSGLEPLFNGIFLGDRTQLTRIQSANIKTMSPFVWDQVRKVLELKLAGTYTIEKLQQRQGLLNVDPFVMGIARKLLKVPPTYDVTNSLITQRLK